MQPSEKKNNNRKEWLKYVIGSIVFLLLAYHSVYFKKLDEVKAAANKKFDAMSFAKAFLATQLTPKLDSAIVLDTLISHLAKDKDPTFDASFICYRYWKYPLFFDKRRRGYHGHQ
ncbi:MAG: DUF2291 family protein [Spirosomataceae bacterium]